MTCKNHVFLDLYFECTGYQDLTDFLLKVAGCFRGENRRQRTRRPGLNGAETDVTSHQDPVGRSPSARKARQTPLGRQDRRKIGSLVADTMLQDPDK